MWVIGSVAAARHKLNVRPPADIDLMASPEDLNRLLHIADRASESLKNPGKWMMRIANQTVEVDATNNNSTKMLTDAHHGVEDCIHDEINLWGFKALVPTASTLWCFKRSHAGYPLFPHKTLADLSKLSNAVIGTEFRETDRTEFLTPFQMRLLESLRAEVKERFERRDRRMNFNRPAKDFFKSAQGVRTYDHDSLHDATSRWESPLYRDNLVDPTKALVDMKQYMARTLDYRLTMAQEEAIVIGLERFYINSRDLTAQQVYQRGMTKLITDLCKGQFQDFVLDHYHLMSKPLWDFMSKFDEAEANGTLQYINEH
jgi:hypothetical protein